MLLKDLVIQPDQQPYRVPLYSDSNFEFDTTIQDNNFTITARTYIDYYTYFTIKVNSIPLCLNNLAKLGTNLCYAPTTTIDGNRHVFFLLSNNSQVTQVHHSEFNKSIFLFYYQTAYENIFTQL